MNRLALGTRNALKLGLFSANLSSGMTATRVSERWRATWDENRQLAQLADERGLEFCIPLARWRGQGGETDYQDWGFETLTWASALLACTQRIYVFGTVHVMLFHPVVAAKMMITADHVGHGRFGVNIVVGPSKAQMPMFNVDVPGGDERYVLAQEWLDIVRGLWRNRDDFDFNGKHFQLRELHTSPGPYGSSEPLFLNAGASGAGQDFAARNSDAFFTSVKNSAFDAATGVVTPDIPVVERIVRDVRARAAGLGREIGVYTNAQVICRPTQKEAVDYYRYALDERADWPAIDNEIHTRTGIRADPSSPEYQDRRRRQIRQFPVIGDPDYVTGLLATLHRGGFDGIGLSMVNYLDELPFILDEVVPRLEKMGLRSPL
jgi:FMNH2-dependent dimethyl sulfone monooxygenase